MIVNKFLWGSLIAGLSLFFWSGITQVFPWGVPTANVIVSQTASSTEQFQAANVEEFPANALTTPLFDTVVVGRVNTLTTDETFSWIVTKPLSYYEPSRYFLREFLTQLLVGILLTILAGVTNTLTNQQRLLLFLTAGTAAAAATYGSLFNWWGLTAIYALGVSLNLILGWLIAGFILIRFVFKSKYIVAARSNITAAQDLSSGL